MEPNQVTVLIADDHPLFLAGIRRTLEEVPTLQLVAEASDGEAALRAIEAEKPALAVMDIRMPRLSGLQVARELRQRNLATDVIFLTMYDDEETFNAAMDLGVMGYVSKESAVNDVVAAIETVVAGRHFISPLLMDLMVARRSQPAVPLRQTLPNGISPTERKILKLIAESKTSKEIAEAFSISQRTVENHRAHISSKLGIHGSYSLLKFALENKAHL
ncbi:response regulator transcription factor [Geothrix sp. PMB-07]|uniref:response regulator n=1 Tax=Geothrix sp. PMB-07 TaxID=3068640 RepID=UPI00274268BE|nr:response regulator transcription factor [Geothrix sp. PMB-07]WLT33462.1 response regulator transcription factor [Geothrix sp. PMB-07]